MGGLRPRHCQPPATTVSRNLYRFSDWLFFVALPLGFAPQGSRQNAAQPRRQRTGGQLRTGRELPLSARGGRARKAASLRRRYFRLACCTRRGRSATPMHWHNIELRECDAADYAAVPCRSTRCCSGLSYNTMPHHRAVLRHAPLLQLRPGGRLSHHGRQRVPRRDWADLSPGAAVQPLADGAYPPCRAIRSFTRGRLSSAPSPAKSA